MIDYQALLLDPIYAVLGVPAVVTLADSTRVEGLTVIDKTDGLQVGEKESKIDTVLPACCIRAAEWIERGYTIAQFEDASIAFNGSLWDVKAYPKRPVPSGVRAGEVLLILGNESPEPESDESDSSS